MDFTETSASKRICKVAFALNSKKLRKSSFSEPSSSTPAVCASESPQSPKRSGNSSSGNDKGGEWRGGGLADILSDEVTEGVQFFAFDASSASSSSIQEQPVYDIIVHKLTEDLDKEESNGVVNDGDSSGDRLYAIRQYLKEHPRTIIIDPLESVKIVTSRARTSNMLRHVCANIYGVCQPKYVLMDNIDDLTEAKLLENMDLHGLKFPVICKPLKACGSPTSHHMVVVVDVQGLSLITFPCIIQQYHNHSSVFYKAYVIGTEVMVFRRPSLPDLEIGDVSSLAFDSRLEYPSLKEFTKEYNDNSCVENVTTDNDGACSGISTGVTSSNSGVVHQSEDYDEKNQHDVLSDTQHEMYISECPASLEKLQGNFLDAAGAISARFGLSLFGFDVILPVDDEDKIFVIDVNFFPSYKEVSDFPSKLRNYFRKKAVSTHV